MCSCVLGGSRNSLKTRYAPVYSGVIGLCVFSSGSGPLIPYGLPCVRELFRFLISLTNPLDRHNTDVMIHMGLSLLTVALESGADHISAYSSLLSLVKDDMCKNVFFVSCSHLIHTVCSSMLNRPVEALGRVGLWHPLAVRKR